MQPIEADPPHGHGLRSALNLRHWSISAKLIALTAPLLLVSVVAASWYFPGRQHAQFLDEQVALTAKTILSQVRAEREYYATKVIPRLTRLNAKSKADTRKGPSATPLAATVLREIADMAAHAPSSYPVRLVSPWPINKRHAIQDSFQEEGFRSFTPKTDGLFSRQDTVAGVTVMRFLAPDRAVAQSCVDCHNQHPDSPRHNFRLNDIMGAIEVSIPIEAPLQQARRDQWWLLWGGIGVGLLLTGLIAWGTKYTVIKPMRELKDRMQKIAQLRGEVNETEGIPDYVDAAMAEEVRALWQQFSQMHETIATHQRDRTLELERQAETHRLLNHRLLELQQITQVLQQAVSEEEVYRILSHTLQQALHLRQIFILRLNASEDRLEIVYTSPKRHDLGTESYPVWDAPSRCPVIRSGREYRVQDIHRDLTCPSSLSNEGDGAYWCVPLVIGGRTIGVVHLVSDVTQPWTEESRQWIEALINVAAPMIGHLQHLERARRRALIDELTSTFNRRFLEEVLAKMILPGERRKNQMLSLLMIDLDHFKLVNDTFGHQVGDIVLKTVAAALHRALKESDTLARYGGEEFVAVLPQTDTGAALAVAERLRVAVEGLSLRKLAPATPDHVTISVGVATYPTQAKTVQELIRLADEALYQAKSLGRNRVVGAPTQVSVGAEPGTEQDEDS
ncbi:MAG: diguanylate cyclase [Nitrospiraceae bacterium]